MRIHDTRIRKKMITDAAIAIAMEHGHHKITRDRIAERANCSAGLVSYFFSPMKKFRQNILQYGIQNEIVPIIAHAIITGDLKKKTVSEKLKRKAANYLVNL